MDRTRMEALLEVAKTKKPPLPKLGKLSPVQQYVMDVVKMTRGEVYESWMQWRGRPVPRRTLEALDRDGKIVLTRGTRTWREWSIRINGGWSDRAAEAWRKDRE